MNTNRVKKSLLLVGIIIVSIITVAISFSSKASADVKDEGVIKSYESVLIKSGDTLTSIAQEHAASHSNYSPNEYLKCIIDFNDLTNDYINAGEYILLPNYL